MTASKKDHDLSTIKPKTEAYEEASYQATRFLYDGKYVEAIQLFNTLLQIDPEATYLTGLRDEAQKKLAQGEYPERIIPLDARKKLNHARRLASANEFEKARLAYQEAYQAAISPNMPHWNQIDLEVQDLERKCLLHSELQGIQELIAQDKFEEAVSSLERISQEDLNGFRLNLLQPLSDFLHAEKEIELIAAEIPDSTAGFVQRITIIYNIVQNMYGSYPDSLRVNSALSKIKDSIKQITDNTVLRAHAYVGKNPHLDLWQVSKRIYESLINDLTAVQSINSEVELENTIHKVKTHLNQLDSMEQEIKLLLDSADTTQAHEFILTHSDYFLQPVFTELVRKTMYQYYTRGIEYLNRGEEISALQYRDKMSEIQNTLSQSDFAVSEMYNLFDGACYEFHKEKVRNRRLTIVAILVVIGLLVGAIVLLINFLPAVPDINAQI